MTSDRQISKDEVFATSNVSGRIMTEQKRKLISTEKAERQRRRKEFLTIFVKGKQKYVKHPPTIDSIDVDEFIRRNADPIFLHQNETWGYLDDILEERKDTHDESTDSADV